MKTYLADIIPKIQRFSQKLDNITLLTNQHWEVIDEISKSKIVYIFRDGGKLLISQNGKVEKAHWEYLGNNSLLIDLKDESYLFRHGFFDENILALKVDGKDEYAFLVNESKYDGELNSMESIFKFLNNKYLIGENFGGNLIYQKDYSELSSAERKAVEYYIPSLKKGDVIVKYSKDGSIQTISYKYYKQWIDYYGSDSLKLLASTT